MRLLAFSDLHEDVDQAERLVELSREADAVIAAGDFASQHRGLEPTIDALRPIEKPTVLVPGNNETDDALREACTGWQAATVLHGEGVEIDGTSFFGLGAGVPTTPWDWSFDLSDEEAAAKLADCSPGGVLVVHSPPKGHADGADHLGSEAILETIESKKPKLAVCGHIHDAWRERSEIGPTRVLNLGPKGTLLEV